MEILTRIAQGFWGATLDAAPYVLMAAVLAGILRAFMSTEKLRKMLSERSWKSVAKAALIGAPLPLCSCSVLPVAMQVRRSGASRGATSAFLVSTPETGVDSVVMSVGMLNPGMAAARVFGALVSAFTAGLLQNRFGGDDPEPPKPAVSGGMAAALALLGQKPPTIWERLRDGQKYAFTDLLPGMAHYYLFGLLATGAVMALLPENFLGRFLGGDLLGMIGLAMLGMVTYTCASSSTPLAAALIAKGMSPGTALVMLLAGPATSMASMAAVRSMLGTRGLAIYLGSILVCAVGVGQGVDALNNAMLLGLENVRVEVGHAHHMSGASIFTTACAIVLLAFLVYHTVLKYWRMLRTAKSAVAVATKSAAAPAAPAKKACCGHAHTCDEEAPAAIPSGS